MGKKLTDIINSYDKPEFCDYETELKRSLREDPKFRWVSGYIETFKSSTFSELFKYIEDILEFFEKFHQFFRPKRDITTIINTFFYDSLKKRHLVSLNFSNCKFENLSLEKCLINGCSFRNCKFINVKIHNCFLYTDFIDCKFDNVVIDGCIIDYFYLQRNQINNLISQNNVSSKNLDKISILECVINNSEWTNNCFLFDMSGDSYNSGLQSTNNKIIDSKIFNNTISICYMYSNTFKNCILETENINIARCGLNYFLEGTEVPKGYKTYIYHSLCCVTEEDIHDHLNRLIDRTKKYSKTLGYRLNDLDFEYYGLDDLNTQFTKKYLSKEKI